MKKVLIGALILILAAVMAVFFARSSSDEDTKQEKETGDITLYYVSIDGMSFYQVPYNFSKPGKTLRMAEEVLEQLKTVPQNEDCQVTIPQSVIWSDVNLEDTNLVIDFTSSYSKLSSVNEIFLRAGVVKSLVQLDGIHSVEFKQNGTPLMTLDEQPVGMMTAESFIDDSNENWGVTQEDIITLYYANESGDRLVGEDARVTVENNVPMEQEIIERLIAGSDKNGCYQAIPEGTKVIKTVTKNGTCYVDLNENFLNPMESVSAEVTVYSVVNSLTELSSVSKVQFTINGEKVSRLRESLDFDVSFERNLDLEESALSEPDLEETNVEELNESTTGMEEE
ncbi:MAG: GerMN domain-containing protein [Lachnospiraceae bacterium]|nr:GerMN domain-containing protein [Lachnospiraceae bacterium]